MLKIAGQMAWAAALAFIVFVALTAISVSQPHSQTQQEQSKQQPAEHYGPSNPNAQNNSPQNPKSGADKNKEQNYWERFVSFVETRDKLVTAISTVVIAAFTAALFLATFSLWSAGEKHSELQLRAYISVRADYVYAFGPNILVVIKFSMLNHGQTPAYKVSQAAAVDILPFPLPKGFCLPENTTPASGSFVLHPQASLAGHVVAKRTFSADEIRQVTTNDGARIYVYGAVKYKDAFKRNRETMFCFSIIGDNNLIAVSGGTPIPTVEINFQPSEEFNQAD